MTSLYPLNKMLTFSNTLLFFCRCFFWAFCLLFYMSEARKDRLRRAAIACHQASAEFQAATADYLINCMTDAVSSGPLDAVRCIRLGQQMAQEMAQGIAPLVQVQLLAISDYKTMSISHLTYSIIFTCRVTLPQGEGRCQLYRLDHLLQPHTSRTWDILSKRH